MPYPEYQERSFLPPGFIERAPGIKIPAKALQQVIGWSTELSQPVLLREYVAARAPEYVRVNLKVPPVKTGLVVKRANELTDEEIHKTALEILKNEHNNYRVVSGDGDFSPAELTDQVATRTGLGPGLVIALMRHIEVMESLVDTGRITGILAPGEKLPEPEFPF